MTTRSRREEEAEVTAEFVLAESSRPDEPISAADAAWRASPGSVRAYEARLLSLRGAFEALDDGAADVARP